MAGKPIRSGSIILRMVVAFDGTSYVGWQRQPNGMSAQQKIEEVLARVGGKPVVVHGASRTDTGVHALGMAAHFEWPRKGLAAPVLFRALNGLLPEDIRILKLEEAPGKFHSRFDAKWKLYRYRILNAQVNDPFRRGVTWFIHVPLKVVSMQKAARQLVGKHDFTSFAVNPGYERTSMVRRIRRCDVRKRGDEVHVEVEADGFLYKMVRTIVGTLVEVGEGERKPGDMKPLLKARDRRQSGKTAPPQGLFLVRVEYGKKVK